MPAVHVSYSGVRRSKETDLAVHDLATRLIQRFRAILALRIEIETQSPGGRYRVALCPTLPGGAIRAGGATSLDLGKALSAAFADAEDVLSHSAASMPAALWAELGRVGHS
jgi:hypothetical protein